MILPRSTLFSGISTCPNGSQTCPNGARRPCPGRRYLVEHLPVQMVLIPVQMVHDDPAQVDAIQWYVYLPDLIVLREPIKVVNGKHERLCAHLGVRYLQIHLLLC